MVVGTGPALFICDGCPGADPVPGIRAGCGLGALGRIPRPALGGPHGCMGGGFWLVVGVAAVGRWIGVGYRGVLLAEPNMLLELPEVWGGGPALTDAKPGARMTEGGPGYAPLECDADENLFIWCNCCCCCCWWWTLFLVLGDVLCPCMSILALTSEAEAKASMCPDKYCAGEGAGAGLVPDGDCLANCRPLSPAGACVPRLGPFR